MKNKRVAFFISSYFDGIGVNTLRLAEEFSRDGYEVDVLIVSDEKEKIKIKNSNLNIIDFKQSSTYKAFLSLKKYIKKNKPDVIVSGGEAPNIVLILANMFSFKKVKTIVSIRTHLSTQYKHTKILNQTILKYLGKLFYRFADEIVAVSKGVADDVAKLFYIKRDKINVIYNPIVNEQTFELAEQPVSHRWFKNKNIPVILGVGRLAKQKNFPLLIESFAILRKKTKVKLIIVGEGNEREKLEKKISDYKLENDIDLIGYVPNPYSYMKNSDIFVLSSDWEGFGNVIVEAMACGTRIVSTNCPSGPSEILDNGKYGDLVKDATAENLSDAIHRSLKNNDFESVENIQRAKEFSVINTMRQYEQIFND